MCLYPRLMKNPKYTANKKNGGKIPPVCDYRVNFVPIGCGNCVECRKQKANDWIVRLEEDIKYNKNGCFVTLTFSSESIRDLGSLTDLKGYERDNFIARIAVRRFLERYRKKHGKSVRHWLVTELGHKGTEHIHLHGILFLNDHKEISKFWKYGYVWDGYTKNGKRVNYVNGSTIGYCVKYVSKIDPKHKYYRPQILCSPGIGAGYIGKHNSKLHCFNEKDTRDYYISSSGRKLAMPKYFKNKLYSDEEKEALWLHKLDKMERWVCGEKISAYDDALYIDTVNYYRDKFRKMGYGGWYFNTEEAEYENRRRDIIFERRSRNITPVWIPVVLNGEEVDSF